MYTILTSDNIEDEYEYELRLRGLGLACLSGLSGFGFIGFVDSLA